MRALTCFAILAAALAAVTFPAQAQSAESSESFSAPVAKGSPITYEKLLQSVFKGAREKENSDTLVTASEKVLRRVGTKERTALPAGTPLTSLNVLHVRGDGKRYLILLCEAESDATEVVGGGAAILAVFPEGSTEAQDVADVKEDRWCYFPDGPLLALGPDDAFTVLNTHSNSDQTYWIRSIFHVRERRLRLIDSCLTLDVRGTCQESFQEALAVRAEPDPGSPYPKVVATITLTKGPREEEAADCPKPKAKAVPKVYTEICRWDKAAGRYVSDKGFEAIDKFNMDHM
jgi:hypothetical protein